MSNKQKREERLEPTHTYATRDDSQGDSVSRGERLSAVFEHAICLALEGGDVDTAAFRLRTFGVLVLLGEIEQ